MVVTHIKDCQHHQDKELVGQPDIVSHTNIDSRNDRIGLFIRVQPTLEMEHRRIWEPDHVS